MKKFVAMLMLGAVLLTACTATVSVQGDEDVVANLLPNNQTANDAAAGFFSNPVVIIVLVVLVILILVLLLRRPRA